jgi:hypothetical protein
MLANSWLEVVAAIDLLNGAVANVAQMAAATRTRANFDGFMRFDSFGSPFKFISIRKSTLPIFDNSELWAVLLCLFLVV